MDIAYFSKLENGNALVVFFSGMCNQSNRTGKQKSVWAGFVNEICLKKWLLKVMSGGHVANYYGHYLILFGSIFKVWHCCHDI